MQLPRGARRKPCSYHFLPIVLPSIIDYKEKLP
jgi:hypothetical protein